MNLIFENDRLFKRNRQCTLSFLVKNALLLLIVLNYACKIETLPDNCNISVNIVEDNKDVHNIHDPTIIKEGDTYYLYSSSKYCTFYTSKDMKDWKKSGTVFKNKYPTWLTDYLPNADHIGAPDIKYYNGNYVLFYQSHMGGTCNSVIGFATNKTLDPQSPNYKWIDHGPVIKSKQIGPYGIINCGDGRSTYNAIDPHLFIDNDNTPWLSFGSTWGGIKLVKLQALSLKEGFLKIPQKEPYNYMTLAKRNIVSEADPVLEASYIVYRSGYYYLFMSHNKCCPGETSKYKIMVGRSARIEGPYVDKSGGQLLFGEGSLVIDRDGKYIGTGHADVFYENNSHYLVHHAYDSENNYVPVLNIRKLKWDSEGWPTICIQ